MAADSRILDDVAPRVAARYHPALVALHWLMALLIVAMLTMGFAVLANTADANP